MVAPEFTSASELIPVYARYRLPRPSSAVRSIKLTMFSLAFQRVIFAAFLVPASEVNIPAKREATNDRQPPTAQ